MAFNDWIEFHYRMCQKYFTNPYRDTLRVFSGCFCFCSVISFGTKNSFILLFNKYLGRAFVCQAPFLDLSINWTDKVPSFLRLMIWTSSVHTAFCNDSDVLFVHCAHQ